MVGAVPAIAEGVELADPERVVAQEPVQLGRTRGIESCQGLTEGVDRTRYVLGRLEVAHRLALLLGGSLKGNRAGASATANENWRRQALRISG